jgi:hypothetical protein
MSVEIQWTDVCPDTGEKRFVVAERFARGWTFKVRFKRREDWRHNPPVTRAMWEELLDAVERRLPRREGVTEGDVGYIRQQLARYAEGEE